MVISKPKLFLVLLLLAIVVHSTLAAVRTFYAQETDFVKIKAQAVDPDNDKVTYNYTLPLDEQGEWQTGYDDAGEYEIMVAASDGVNKAVEQILLIVKNKNQAPYLTEKKFTVKEMQTIDLKEFVFDPDGDVLSYTFHAPFNSKGLWTPNYESEGSFVTNFKAHDGEFEVSLNLQIEVLNTNQPPFITKFFSPANKIDVKEDEKLVFSVEAVDKDNDELTFQWKFDQVVVSDRNKGSYYLGFDAAGEHILGVMVSDGITTASKEWKINAEDINRAPEIELSPITVNEGATVVLDLPIEDLDGDELSYSFSGLFNKQGEWDTDFDDAGNYTFYLYASDGELTVKKEVNITVNDVDRAPALTVPSSLEVNEGQELSFVADTSDPDGDEVFINLENAPHGFYFNQSAKKFSWTPSYDFIRREGGFFSDVLNALRLENRIITKQVVVMTVTSCGKDLCTSNSIPITVHNFNRKPELEEIEEIVVMETDVIELEPKAVDPDGDIIRYYFTYPLGTRNGKWKTDYGKEGIYNTYVTATDGFALDTVPVHITVLKRNRSPRIEVASDQITVNEGQELNFNIKAVDPDGDNITLRLENIPPGASFNDNLFSWTPDYNFVKNVSGNRFDNLISRNAYLNREFSGQQEVRWLQFVASDKEFDVIHVVKVMVKNLNRRPEIIDYLPVKEKVARIGEPVVFHLLAKDMDDDKLNYFWDFGFGHGDVAGTNTIERTFVTPGEKKVAVTVSDGRKEVGKEWSINVLDQEYAPLPVPESTYKVYVIEW